MRRARTSLVVGLIGIAAVSGSLATRAQAQQGSPRISMVQREQIVDDVFHETIDLQLGSTPNALIRLHRVVRERPEAAWRPRRTIGAIMLLHGDFSTFTSNFAPGLLDKSEKGLAIWLAQQGFDVWGFDRRWALTAADGELSDFMDMSLEQELSDTRVALSYARTLRWTSGAGVGGFHLIGFSRGGYLAYAAAAEEAARLGPRLVRSLVVLDMWAEIAPDDTAARASTCELAAAERELLAAGTVDSENSFFISAGSLALSAPDAPSELSPGQTNRELFLLTAAQTYEFFAPSEFYHLAAPNIADGVVTGLRESPEPVIAQWLAHATPHQAMRESVDTDSIWCGDGQGPRAPNLGQIRAPLLLVAAAGGYGQHAVYSTTRVGSRDVTVHMVQRGAPATAETEIGHGDLLFATDAQALVWQPLAAWLKDH